jgi:transposase InsO family protein
MSLRHEFVLLAQAEGASLTSLCERFGISRKTGYKWRARYQEAGVEGLVDRSRRPQHSPRQTAAAVAAQVLAERAAHPTWGGRKLQARLSQPPHRDAPPAVVPSASTITAIVRRADHLGANPAAPRSGQPHAFVRFEQDAPNLLWQMDFKGHFALQTLQQRCHPLTVLDDHSRFALGVVACANEQATTVQRALTAIFERYGLPECLLSDNGSPWGGAEDPAHPWTRLTVWLLRLGIRVRHGQPYHPQTQGKDERFHRTLREDVLARQVLLTLAHAQAAFDTWRDEYNLVRPHAALGYAVPASRYQPSPRPFPTQLPPITYAPHDQVRQVREGGRMQFQGRVYRVGRAFTGLPVAVRPTTTDGQWEVYFCQQPIATLDQRQPPPLPMC